MGDQASERFEKKWQMSAIEFHWDAHIKQCQLEDRVRSCCACAWLLLGVGGRWCVQRLCAALRRAACRILVLLWHSNFNASTSPFLCCLPAPPAYFVWRSSWRPSPRACPTSFRR